MDCTSESPNLDLLRSTAVTFVVVFHVLLYFQATSPGGVDLHKIGRWGVLLFFVHTSVVLMFSLERQVSHGPNNGLFSTFYARRFFRIYPLSVLVTLVVYLLHLPVAHLHNGSFQAIHLKPSELLSNLLLVQNITHTDSIMAPLWSLPYEMQMYLALPLLFLAARASRSVFALAGIWILSVSAATLSLHIPRYQVPDLLFYVPCFVAGVLAYKLTESRTWNWPFLAWPLTLAAVTTFYLCNPTLQREWICCLLTGLTLPQFREMQATWSRRVCQIVSRYSYGIYLTHFIAIWLAFVVLHSEPRVFQCIAFLVTLVVLPVFLYHTLEAPMIAFGRQGIARSQYPKLSVSPTLREPS